MQDFSIEKRDDGILLFTIRREEKRNAINYAVMDGLKEAIEMAGQPDVKGLVVTGEGEKAFCAGGDLSVFQNLRTAEQAYGMLSKMGNILYELFMLPKPTVALMNGTALGGGCELATACDFRVARTGVKAGFVQGTLAITSGWGGGTMLLEKLPLANAMKMLFEAKRYTAEELKELGFVHYIYDGDTEDGLSTIAHIFQLRAGVLEAYKEMMIRKWRDKNLKEKIDEEIQKCAILWADDEHHELVDQFVNKKAKTEK